MSDMLRDRTILLVEDDANDVELARRAFARVRQIDNVRVLHTAEDALEYLDGTAHGAAAALPTVLILDLNLPGMSGYDLLKDLKNDERRSHMPVVIYTVDDDEDVRERCYSAGANAVVSKPVDIHEFMLTAESIARFWGGFNTALGYDD